MQPQPPSTPPETPPDAPRRAVPTGGLIAAGVLILAAIVAPLLVNTYADKSPELWGFPFFYWYQLLWVPVVALLTTICYLITTRVARPASGVRATPSQPHGGPGEAS